MKRYFLVIAITVVSLLVLNPVFSQSEPGDEKTEKTTEESTTPGEEPETGEKSEKKENTRATLWTDKNGNQFANSNVRFNLVSTDALSDVDFIEYKIDKNEFVKYSGPITLQEDGQHTIIYRSVDKAGNREVDQVFNVTIDNTAPQIRIFPAKPFHKKDGKNYTHPGNFFTLHVTDNFSGVKSIEYSVNSNELKSYEGDVINLKNAGTQFVRYRAVDNLGNKTEDGTLVIEVDSEQPTVEIIASSQLFKVGETSYARRTTGFSVKGTDNGAGVTQIMVRLDGASEWQTYSDTIFFDTEKEHKIEAKAIDAVGNESEVKAVSFTVDDNPPITKIQPVVD